jgi:hypothetical protein
VTGCRLYDLKSDLYVLCLEHVLYFVLPILYIPSSINVVCDWMI